MLDEELGLNSNSLATMSLMKKIVTKGDKRKKKILKFTLNCTHPVKDEMWVLPILSSFSRRQCEPHNWNLGGRVIAAEVARARSRDFRPFPERYWKKNRITYVISHT